MKEEELIEDLTKEDYEIAEKNGLNRRTVQSRYYYYGWTKEKAITTPVKERNPKRNKYSKEWIDKAAENGISVGLLRTRVTVYGMTMEEAATTPKCINKRLGYKRG